MDDLSRMTIQTLGYNALSARWRALFGRAARKIPLDAGFGCPNRDGTISRGGCAFCNAVGSGTGLAPSMDLAAQWEHWRARRLAKWGDVALVAYLQAFSNTHGPAERLKSVLGQLAGLPGLSGLCLGTRPDCLDEEKLDLLAAFPTDELWLELGLQSSNPATLARVNRGHGPDAFARAVTQAAARGLKVVAHVMAGLPGESPTDWDATVDFVNALPVAGIKFHNLLVVRGAPLARDFEAGQVAPPELAEYAGWVARSLARLRPEVVVHRLSADPLHDELIAPAWAGDKWRVHQAVAEALREGNIRQGMNMEHVAI
jgi:radical SAM protein (TIGR01212 family)